MGRVGLESLKITCDSVSSGSLDNYIGRIEQHTCFLNSRATPLPQTPSPIQACFRGRSEAFQRGQRGQRVEGGQRMRIEPKGAEQPDPTIPLLTPIMGANDQSSLKLS